MTRGRKKVYPRPRTQVSFRIATELYEHIQALGVPDAEVFTAGAEHLLERDPSSPPLVALLRQEKERVIALHQRDLKILDQIDAHLQEQRKQEEVGRVQAARELENLVQAIEKTAREHYLHVRFLEEEKEYRGTTADNCERMVNLISERSDQKGLTLAVVRRVWWDLIPPDAKENIRAGLKVQAPEEAKT